MKTLLTWLQQATRSFAKNESGFSLIELMVVIVIMGLLTTIVVVNVLPSQDRAMVEKARTDVFMIEQAIELYRLDTRRYPSLEDGLDVLAVAPRNNSLRTEPYIRSLPLDPWGNPYQYLFPGENGAFDVFSFGADGRSGGDGLNADIGNWVSSSN